MATTSNKPSGGPLPPGRYGAPARGWRVATIAAAAVVCVAFVAWLIWAALHQAHSSLTGQLRSYSVESDHEVKVTVEVSGAGSDAGGSDVVCTVEARASDHGLVGTSDVTVHVSPSGSGSLTTTIRTDREATSADVTGCRH